MYNMQTTYKGKGIAQITKNMGIPANNNNNSTP